MTLGKWARLPRALCGALVIACLMSQPALAAKLALVVGNDAYKNVPRLRNAVADAQAMAAALSAAGYEVSLQTDRTLRQLQSDVRALRQRIAGGDEVVLFFSGHGVQLGGMNYLLPVDVGAESEEQVKDDALALGKALEDLRERRPRFTLAIIDACRDNPFQGSGRSIGGRGLTGVAGASGQMVIYAAGEGQKALDRLGNDDTVRNGLFTRVFVREIARPGVSIRDVLYRVRDEVATLAESVRHEQVPAVYDQVRGNFYFYPPTSSPQAALQPGVPAAPNNLANQPSPSAPATPGRPAVVATAPLTASPPIVVRIGHVGPTTGAIGHLGKDNERGAMLAVEELNAAGVQVGGKAVRLELVAMDDAADPRQGVAAAERLVSAGVVAVVGHLNSGTSIPASPVYARAGIAQISPSATNPRFTRLGHATAFRLILDDARLGESLGRYAAAAQARRLVIVDDRTAYGMGIADSFESGAKAGGGTIVARHFTNDRATDFSDIVRAIAQQRPDAVFFGGMDSVAGPLLRQLRASGVSAPLFGGDGICSSELPKLAGGTLVAGQVLCAEAGGVNARDAQGLRAFNTRFRARFGDDVQVYAPYTYDAVRLIVDAMQRAGSVSASAIVRALPSSDFKGVTGRIRFDQRGDLAAGAMTLYTFGGSRRETVDVLMSW
jgi:branched-chain amino acid transport system substrate-binding protein